MYWTALAFVTRPPNTHTYTHTHAHAHNEEEKPCHRRCGMKTLKKNVFVARFGLFFFC